MDLQSVLAPLHLLSFSTLLGTQLYQTFIVTKICYVSLPRSAFTTLQKRLFPIYFRSQSLLLLLTMITIPSQGPITLVTNKAAWIPFAFAGATAALNLLVYGPRTRQIMIERIHQGGSDSSLVYRLVLGVAVVRTDADTCHLGYRNTRWIA